MNIFYISNKILKFTIDSTMKWTKKVKFIIVLSFLMNMVPVLGQSPSTETDYLASTGKIYVVVIVLVVIFIGILTLLFSLERRLASLEKAAKMREEE